MPNWVTNSLTIEGSPEIVNEIKDLVAKPYIMPVESMGDLNYKVENVPVDSPFSFWNIIKPTNMEEYPKQPWSGDADNRVANPYSWYNWNNTNWGVKWDASNAELVDEVENGENLVLVYNFETPWGVPVPVLVELSRQFPSVLITNEYQEETGWGGEMEFLRGKITAESEYNWKCWACHHEVIGEPPYCDDCEYDMCPQCGHGEADVELQEKCPTHKIQLATTGKE